ncbi:hypothetical protein COCC4DRAFT_155140 [Bipolaris maydis ATCC 48331]|uniref:Histidinol dehydrogenase n=1 Tax=Cochliobolus heterostrophus (strain C4 / ATCC 48331 / race T) TaxID=665024 RepID=N4WEJ1_COCH4|nr:uncharacterized protein COCC4DRAFT_155140 [Bipolaris maydis ATCC 48331]ENH98703.1 hypothetical protein COCC4DRAFT_155140 [Bipolaris maydis ATCC 48331]
MASRYLKRGSFAETITTSNQTDVSSIVKGVIDDILNVRKFAQAQRDSIRDFELETQPVGVFRGQKDIPISFAGAYIPGGRYPLLASAHITILTAKVARVQHVISCTPPIAGKIPNAIVAAMHLAGADEVFILGSVQAVAAMAIRTETIWKVDFIAGPENAFVAEGKRQLFGDIGIDLFAGSTEVLVVADETADPFTVATDILSQAEHGPDTPAVIITTSDDVGRKSMEIIDQLLEDLPTAALAGTSWKAFGEVVVVDSLDEAWKLVDEYASEHGALFLGENTCVSYGDKVIGTNHIFPTRKAARYTGGLWVGKFLRTVTYQEVTDTKASGELGPLCSRAARAEKFKGHARSGDLRAHKHLAHEYPWIKGAQPALGTIAARTRTGTRMYDFEFDVEIQKTAHTAFATSIRL